VANYCEQLGLICLYEPQGMYVNGEGLAVFYREMKQRCQNVGICGDVGNSLFVDYDPRRIFDEFAAEIKHVHLKDYRREQASDGGYPTRGGYRLFDVALGDGHVDILYCLQRLRKIGYRGAYSLEIGGADEVLRAAIAYTQHMIG
jgi:sugar phosphate isomerase/epimerase